jgi:uncharacterized lipoprotein YajG
MLKQAFLAAAISTTLLAGCATTPTHTAHAPMHTANIVDVAKSNPDFSILETFARTDTQKFVKMI